MHAADIQDRDGGVLLMGTLFGLYPFLRTLCADGGYQGPEFQSALRRVCRQVEVEIVKRSDTAKGFAVIPRRWIVERSIAWLNRCRRGTASPCLPPADRCAMAKDLGVPPPLGPCLPALGLGPADG